MLEYTKISIIQYFKEKHKEHLFMARPEFAISKSTKRSPNAKTLIGAPGTEVVIRHELELISAFVNDY